jgi:hypothetical protein
MSRRKEQQKLGTTRGSPRHSRTAKASRISRRDGEIAMCPGVGRRGRNKRGWPGTEEPGSEREPLGRSRTPPPRRRIEESSARHRTGEPNWTRRCAKGRCKPGVHRRMPGAGLSDGCTGKALSDRPAFQPYWGKPAVRNDRGDGGNVGILRSPLRATVLPDCGGAISDGRPYRDSQAITSGLPTTRPRLLEELE